MIGLVRFGVANPVVANLLMGALIAAGIVFGSGLRREFFPETDPTLVRVTAPYPGASPEEVEDALAIKIEDRVRDYVDDVEEISTTIAEGMVTVGIELEEGVNIDRAVFDIKREMDALQDLPEESETINVEVFEPNFPAINVSLYGDADERTMKDAILQIRDDLRSLNGMGDVSLSGVRNDEISVEVNADKLLEHGISLNDVAQRVTEAMTELPGGAVRGETSNSALRIIGTEEEAELIRDIVVQAGTDGGIVRLADIATVRETFADVDLFTRLNGAPAASLTVFKVGDEDAVEMSGLVKAYVAGLRKEPFEPTFLERVSLVRQQIKAIMDARRATSPDNQTEDPEDAANQAKQAVFDQPINERMRAWQLGWSRPPPPGTVVTTTDLARFITGRLELLSRNAAAGLVLVLGVLVLLLNFRVAFWVAMGLVVSILGTLFMMRMTGITLNLLTMFGLIIVLGLLVDDAIVVAENITSRHEKGESAPVAAVRGTAQVGWPVVATVLTTIGAFMPLALIGGQIGDLLEALPFVVAVSLGVSLIESLFILPVHMAHSLEGADRKRARTGRKSFLDRIGARIDQARDAAINGWLVPRYARVLHWSLSHRYIALAIAIGFVIVSMGLVGGKRVGFSFFPSSDSETVNVELRMPVGTPIAETDNAIRILEQAIVDPELYPEITAAFVTVGSAGALDGTTSSTLTHIAQIILELAPVEQRQDMGGRSSADIKTELQKLGADIPGIDSLLIEEVAGGPGGPDITLAVVGDDQNTLDLAASRIKEAIDRFEGVISISDDNEAGRRELRFKLRDEARELGLSVATIAQQVRGWVFGIEAHTFAGDREDVDVRVMLDQDTRRSLASIEEQFIFTPAGDAIPLREAAAISEGKGYSTLRRLDGQRIVTVTADVDTSLIRAEDIMQTLRPELTQIQRNFPGVHIIERGQQEEMADSFSTLPLGLAAAAGAIYVILAWLFGSFLQPIVVMAAIPFATVGMIFGHLLLGFDLTILSLIGFIALTGVVVNDSLIFMEFYNHARREGADVLESAVQAGRARLRAILLTTITTVLGLLPLMLERSFQARFLIPMAITIAGGLISATAIILIVLPCMLVVGRDLRRVAGFLWTGVWSNTDGAPAGSVEIEGLDPHESVR